MKVWNLSENHHGETIIALRLIHGPAFDGLLSPPITACQIIPHKRFPLLHGIRGSLVIGWHLQLPRCPPSATRQPCRAITLIIGKSEQNCWCWVVSPLSAVFNTVITLFLSIFFYCKYIKIIFYIFNLFLILVY